MSSFQVINISYIELAFFLKNVNRYKNPLKFDMNRIISLPTAYLLFSIYFIKKGKAIKHFSFSLNK